MTLENTDVPLLQSNRKEVKHKNSTLFRNDINNTKPG